MVQDWGWEWLGVCPCMKVKVRFRSSRRSGDDESLEATNAWATSDRWTGLVQPCSMYSQFSHDVHAVLLVCFIIQGERLDSREQSCMASCQDQYLETRAQIQKALEARQSSM